MLKNILFILALLVVGILLLGGFSAVITAGFFIGLIALAGFVISFIVYAIRDYRKFKRDIK